MEKILQTITRLEDHLGGQPRWAWLSFFDLGYATIGYGVEYKKFEKEYNMLLVLLDDFVTLYPKEKDSVILNETIKAFVEGKVFYDFKRNKTRMVLKQLRTLKNELKMLDIKIK